MDPNANSNHEQPGDNARRKTIRRTVILTLLCIALVSVSVFAFTLLGANNSNNRPSTKSTDTRSTDSDWPPSETTDSSPAEPSATGTVITTGDSEFGPMLFNEKKQAIYIWELEESETPECYGDCAEAWPPVLTDGDPQATGDVNGSLLGTTQRSDGSTQVTYNGHPLYYYAHEGAGEVECHNIKTHGGLWWVIQPNGERAI